MELPDRNATVVTLATYLVEYFDDLLDYALTEVYDELGDVLSDEDAEDMALSLTVEALDEAVAQLGYQLTPPPEEPTD